MSGGGVPWRLRSEPSLDVPSDGPAWAGGRHSQPSPPPTHCSSARRFRSHVAAPASDGFSLV